MTNSATRTAAATAIGVAALATAVTGCSNTAAHPDARRTATPTAPSSTAPHPSGTQLAALMPTASQLGAGLRIVGASNTASAWTTPAHLPDPTLPSTRCTSAPGISAQTLTADYRAASAAELIDDNGATLRLLVAATNEADAAKQLKEVRDFASRCATFPVPGASGAVTAAGLTVDTFAGVGDEAIRIRVTGAAQQREVVLVRVGDEIAAVCDPDLTAHEAATISLARYLADRLDGKPA